MVGLKHVNIDNLEAMIEDIRSHFDTVIARATRNPSPIERKRNYWFVHLPQERFEKELVKKLRAHPTNQPERFIVHRTWSSTMSLVSSPFQELPTTKPIHNHLKQAQQDSQPRPLSNTIDPLSNVFILVHTSTWWSFVREQASLFCLFESRVESSKLRTPCFKIRRLRHRQRRCRSRQGYFHVMVAFILFTCRTSRIPSSLFATSFQLNKNNQHTRVFSPRTQRTQLTARRWGSLASTTSTSTQRNDFQQGEDDRHMEWLLHHWKEETTVNPILHFETWVAPSEFLSQLIRDPLLQPLLAHPPRQANSYGDNSNNHNMILQHVHPRIKLIQDYNETHKLLLRSPVMIQLPSQKVTMTTANTSDEVTLTTVEGADKNEPCNPEIQAILRKFCVVDGPLWTKQLSYRNLSLSYILSQLLSSCSATATKGPHPRHQQQHQQYYVPVLSTDLPTAYEQVGHIAHFNFKPHHLPYSRLVGQILVEIHPTIEMVVHKVGQVSGPYRTYPLEILATKSNAPSAVSNNDDKDQEKPSLLSTEATLVEHGLSISLDLATCYWCTRLSGERQVLLREIASNSLIADVFCGVGTFCLLANRDKRCSIMANDWNPSAIEYFRRNMLQQQGSGGSTDVSDAGTMVATSAATSKRKKNHGQGNNKNKQSTTSVSLSIDPCMFALSCVDTYEYLMDIGLGNVELPSGAKNAEGGEVVLPDHVIMNFPLDAPSFLGSLRWWPTNSLQERELRGHPLPRFHVYTFARADREDDVDEQEMEDLPLQQETQDSQVDGTKSTKMELRTEVDVAVDAIAEALLPGFGGSDGNLKFRRAELDQDYQCQVQTRVVRDVAPGKVCVCVSFTLTSKLIRHMQGDYYDHE